MGQDSKTAIAVERIPGYENFYRALTATQRTEFVTSKLNHIVVEDGLTNPFATIFSHYFDSDYFPPAAVSFFFHQLLEEGRKANFLHLASPGTPPVISCLTGRALTMVERLWYENYLNTRNHYRQLIEENIGQRSEDADRKKLAFIEAMRRNLAQAPQAQFFEENLLILEELESTLRQRSTAEQHDCFLKG